MRDLQQAQSPARLMFDFTHHAAAVRAAFDLILPLFCPFPIECEDA